MGSEKTVVSSNQQATPTAEETALNKLRLSQLQFMDPMQREMYTNLSGNINSILTGQTPMAQGIGGINAQQSQQMATAGVNSLYPQFQQSGIMDSGLAAALAGRTYADIQNQNAQFNVSAAQNLFNIAAGGQSNLQGQATSLGSSLASSLAGLRRTEGTQTTSGMNPFLKSFQTSLGTTLGSPKFGMGPLSFGG